METGLGSFGDPGAGFGDVGETGLRTGGTGLSGDAGGGFGDTGETRLRREGLGIN